MRALLRLGRQGFSKKLGIADTAKVIQEKIMNITQVVRIPSPRTTSNNSALSSALETVSPEWLDSTKSRQEKWSSSDQVSEVWHSTWKQTMSESSSSEMIGTNPHIQRNSRRRHRHQNRSHRRCPHRRRNVRSSLRCTR